MNNNNNNNSDQMTSYTLEHRASHQSHMAQKLEINLKKLYIF